MLIQFYKHENLIKVFRDRNSLPFFVIENAIKSHAYLYLGFKARPGDWIKTSFGSEIELMLVPKVQDGS